MTSASGWDGILDQGERILWQGQPSGGIAINSSSVPALVFGVLFSGFALFWMIGARLTGDSFWMFGLVHFFAGLAVIAGPVFWPVYRRRHSWYTLTDRRAFIATDLPFVGRRLKSYPITDETELEFVDKDPPSIHFATRIRRTKSNTNRLPVGFERIDDGHAVYRLFRAIQNGETPEPLT